MALAEIEVDRDIVSQLGGNLFWRGCYIRDVILAHLLEPTNEMRRKRILVALAIDLARMIKLSNNSDPILIGAMEALYRCSESEPDIARRAGSPIYYRQKLKRSSRESSTRSHGKKSSAPTSALQIGRRQSHLGEVATIGILAKLLIAGSSQIQRGYSTMEAARKLIVGNKNGFPVSVYRNELAIKRAWQSKGKVAHLCAAFIVLLERAERRELSKNVYVWWAYEIESFLELAFDFQDFLTERRNFPPQSHISKNLLKLPEFLKRSSDLAHHIY